MAPDEAIIREAIEQAAFRTVFQPIYSLHTGQVTGFEALSRFAIGPVEAPAPWFRRAHELGLGVELELAALRRALATASDLPPDTWLSVNLSPAALLDTRAFLLLSERQVANLVLEITEQSPLHGYPELLQQRERLRDHGVRVAVDDVGVTLASVRHQGWLSPDHVKADLSLTNTIEHSRAKRLFARSLVRRAHRHGAKVVAEGVETPAQLSCWRRLGADAIQGFLLATPAPLPQALQAPPISQDLPLRT